MTDSRTRTFSLAGTQISLKKAGTRTGRRPPATANLAHPACFNRLLRLARRASIFMPSTNAENAIAA